MDEFLYQQFLHIIPISILINNFHFYLSESVFISQLIGIYEATNNNVMIAQERSNLGRDLNFVE